MGASEQSNQTPEPSPSPGAQYIASIDVGTTTIRCFIYNNQARLCGGAEEKASGFIINIFLFFHLFMLFLPKVAVTHIIDVEAEPFYLLCIISWQTLAWSIFFTSAVISP